MQCRQAVGGISDRVPALPEHVAGLFQLAGIAGVGGVDAIEQ